MSNSKLNFSIIINTKQAQRLIDSLQTSINKVQETLSANIQLNLDSSEAESRLDGIDNRNIVVDGDAGGLVSAANEAEDAVEDVPDTKEVQFIGENQPLLQSMAQISLAMSGLQMAYSKAQSILGSYIMLSHTQELAEQNLINAMRVKGIATEQNVNSVMNLASATQNLTRVGDEESMQLLTLATNMGIANDKMEETLQGSIGLATAFASAGLSRETAMKGIALAYQGEFTQLQRYIPALRTAKDETEKMAVLQEAMANGFELSKAEVNTGAGAMDQYKNQVGDLKEKIGDMIDQALTPLIKGLTEVTKFLNEYPGLAKATILVLGSLSVAIALVTTKQIALNTAKAIGAALSGNWVALAAAAAVGLGLYGLSVATASEKQVKFNDTVKDSNSSLKTQEERFQEATKKAKEYAEALDYVSAKKSLAEVLEQIEKLNNQYNMRADSPVFIGDEDEARQYYDILNELLAKEHELKGRIRAIDSQAVSDYYAEKAKLDYEATLKGAELSQYRLEQVEAEYEALGELDAENVEAKLELYQKIVKYRQEIAAAEVASEENSLQNQIDKLNEKKMGIVQYYADLTTLSAVNYETMKDDLDAYLEKAEEIYGADSEAYLREQEEVARIKKATNMKLVQEQGAFVSQIAALSRTGLEKEIVSYNNLLERLRSLYAENSEEYKTYQEAITEAYAQRAMDEYAIEEETYADKMRKIEDHFAAYHNILRASGMDEVAIKKAIEDAKQKLQNETVMAAISTGSQLMNAYQGQSKTMFAIGKGLSIAQATINGFEAVSRAFKDYPWPANLIVAAAQAALSGVQVAKIAETKFTPKAESGGLLRGNSHAKGGIIIEAEGGEYITRKSRVAELGTDFFNVINTAPIDYVLTYLRTLLYSTPIGIYHYDPKKFKKKESKAESGGLLKGNSHDKGGMIIEAEGGEYITRKSRVAELGAGLFNFINNAPLEAVQNALSGLQSPSFNVPAIPQIAYAGGGQVSGGMQFGELLDEIRDLKRVLVEKELVVNNNINPNEVINRADAVLVSEKSSTGNLIRGLF